MHRAAYTDNHFSKKPIPLEGATASVATWVLMQSVTFYQIVDRLLEQTMNSVTNLATTGNEDSALIRIKRHHEWRLMDQTPNERRGRLLPVS